jgi:hypothetical protein
MHPEKLIFDGERLRTIRCFKTGQYNQSVLVSKLLTLNLLQLWQVARLGLTMRKYFFLAVIILALFGIFAWLTSATDCGHPTIDVSALFIHTELSVVGKSKTHIIASVTLRNDTTFFYWVFPAVIPGDHPAMPVFLAQWASRQFCAGSM